MRNAVRFGAIVLACFLATGCFSIDTVVHVNKDGSGTVTEQMLMGHMFVEQMKAMASQMGSMGGETAGGGFNLIIINNKICQPQQKSINYKGKKAKGYKDQR